LICRSGSCLSSTHAVEITTSSLGGVVQLSLLTRQFKPKHHLA